MKAFDDNVTQLFDAIEDCLAKGRLLPCLTLLYSGIDVIASLERKPGEGACAAFVRWTEENLLKVHPLQCTGLELYAARCGVVHTLYFRVRLVASGICTPDYIRLGYSQHRGLGGSY